MKLVFRLCVPEDINVLRELSKRTYFETFAAMNTPENMEAYLQEAFAAEKIRAEMEDVNSSFFFLYADGVLAGYLKLNEALGQTDIYDGTSLEIERIYVSKEFQGRKLGQYLMDQAVGIASQRNKTYVWLGVWEKNAHALPFYKRNGFYCIGTHSFVMGDDAQTDYILRKDL